MILLQCRKGERRGESCDVTFFFYVSAHLENKKRLGISLLVKVFPLLSAESRRDQEEGGELDSHEEVSPEEIKRREVSWTLTKKLAQKRSRAGRWCWAGELDFFYFSCFPTAELRTLSL